MNENIPEMEGANMAPVCKANAAVNHTSVQLSSAAQCPTRWLQEYILCYAYLGTKEKETKKQYESFCKKLKGRSVLPVHWKD